MAAAKCCAKDNAQWKKEERASKTVGEESAKGVKKRCLCSDNNSH
jgi:hypothetical protein